MAILDSAAIMPRTCVAADQVLVLDTVGSTNTYAADLVRAGRLFGMDGMDGIAGNLVWSGREIVVVAANEQTAGRGRLDHTWASVPGESFIVSLVVSVPPVLKRFLPWSTAAWVLAMTPPLRSVSPLTLTWKPPSPACMPLCSVTLW